jgi:hypothetical protein
MNLPIFTVGVVCIFIALIGGKFKILGAEISEKVNSKWIRSLFLAFGIVALLVAFNINPQARMQGQMLDTDLPGEDLETVITNSAEECSSACQANSNCKSYTFKSVEQRCFLKDGQPETQRSGGLISGYKK